MLTRRFGRVLLTNSTLRILQPPLHEGFYSYLISPLFFFAFSVFVANITCLAFGNMIPYDVRVGGRVGEPRRGSLTGPSSQRRVTALAIFQLWELYVYYMLAL